MQKAVQETNSKKSREKIEPDISIEVNNELRLELLDQMHKSALFATVTKNREFMNDACDWANNFDEEDKSEQFINYFKSRESSGRQYCYAIMKDTALVGCVSIILRKSHGEIGYWLDKDMTGRGIVTICSNLLIDQGFTKYKCKEMRLNCQQKNVKSSNVALRLGFQFHKTLDDTMHINGQDWVIDEYILTLENYHKLIESKSSEKVQEILDLQNLTLEEKV